MHEPAPLVLVVEDDEVDRRIIARYLAGSCEIEMAGDLREARELLSARPPEIVLLDLILPDGSGRALLEETEEDGPAFIVLTGAFTSDVGVDVLRAGAVDYVSKASLTSTRLSAAIDLARARRALAAVRQRPEAVLEALVSLLPDTVVVLDANGRITRVSPGSGAPWVGEEHRERKLVDVIEPSAAVVVKKLLRATCERGLSPTAVVERMRTDDRPLRWECRMAGVPVTGEVLVVVRDVTHAFCLEEQVRAAQRAESAARLASGVAHDFNNALTVIKSYATVLKRRLRDDEAAADLEAILDAAERATRVASRLVDVTRRRASGRSDVAKLLVSLERGIGLLVGEGVRFSVSVPGEPLLADIEAEQLEQVLLNLIVNAREAMPSGGTITVRAAAVKDRHEPALATARQVEITVEDTGTGIAPADLPHIFEPLFTTKPGSGAGLGLPNVSSIVRGLGGTVDVETEVGRGSRFVVRLPSAAEEGPRSEGLRTDGLVDRAGRGAPRARRE